MAARSRPARLCGARYRSAPRGAAGRWQTERRRAVTRLATRQVSIRRAVATHGCVLGACGSACVACVPKAASRKCSASTWSTYASPVGLAMEMEGE